MFRLQISFVFFPPKVPSSAADTPKNVALLSVVTHTGRYSRKHPENQFRSRTLQILGRRTTVRLSWERADVALIFMVLQLGGVRWPQINVTQML